MANIKPRKRGRAAAQTEPSKTKEVNVAQPPRKSPGDQPLASLRKYIKRYQLRVATPMTIEGFILRGNVGRYSESGQRKWRTSYGQASRAVTEHLRGGAIKEGDAIAEFLYAVNNRNSEFKLRFGEHDKPSGEYHHNHQHHSLHLNQHQQQNEQQNQQQNQNQPQNQHQHQPQN